MLQTKQHCMCSPLLQAATHPEQQMLPLALQHICPAIVCRQVVLVAPHSCHRLIPVTKTSL